jgi:hypothetical protein
MLLIIAFLTSPSHFEYGAILADQQAQGEHPIDGLPHIPLAFWHPVGKAFHFLVVQTTLPVPW